MLETDGVNFRMAMCVHGVDLKRTYTNSRVEFFNVLGNGAAHMDEELRGCMVPP